MKFHKGTKLSAVYDGAASLVKSKKPQLEDKLTKNVGFGTGIEFREGALLITAKSHITARKGEITLCLLIASVSVMVLIFVGPEWEA